MTFRLVGLMTAVLLVSLAAFGLLMNHYQDRVMRELTQTVSAVGRAALNSFVYDVAPSAGEPMRWVERRVVRDSGGVREEHRLTYGVELDEVRAEEDPSRGIVLRIPTRVASGAPGGAAASGEGGPAETEVHIVQLDVRGGEPGQTREIVLPISTRDYDALFSQFERRSLLLFVGVMALGTAASAGVASRFTRPIRRLDSGIRRIAEGDLDATVEVGGADEIARLGGAFNDMVRRLRTARDRDRELTRREKLSALGRLAAGVAHDVRNPLHSIGLTLQHLQETGRPRAAERAAEFDRSVGVIRDEIRRLDGLVANFLRFARSDPGERQATDLGRLLEETARLVGKEAEWRRIEVAVEVERPLPSVEVDTEAVRSSILNLVLNGFDAMPDGGRVTLSARPAGAAVEVTVADTGEGIAAEEREKVFDFAYTTRDGGHGLGLAMVHQCVVEDHGGRVSLDSRPGAGTRVTLSFPSGPTR